MSWIQTISYAAAKSSLKKIYDRIKGPKDQIDNVLAIHSLRPHTLIGHMTLYKSVLHHTQNTLPKWYLETLGVYVSHLNNCTYCVDHHAAGLARLIADASRSEAILEAIRQNQFGDTLTETQVAGLAYARQLTVDPSTLTQAHIESLRRVGFEDGEILEINQVVSYFNYVNRSVLGLGVNTQGEVLGLSPQTDDEPESWHHT